MFFYLLMVAGNDSTRAVFTSGMKNLIDDPEQMDSCDRGRSRSSRSSRSSSVMTPRSPTCDAPRHATPSSRAGRSRGDKLALWYVSANRDAERVRRPA